MRNRNEARGARVAELLSRRSMSTDELTNTLGVSQPTLSRTIQQIPNVLLLRVTGVRAPRYALVRRLPGNIDGHQKVYGVDPAGSISALGEVSLLMGGQAYVQSDDGSTLYEGLPPAMAFAAPSGFLGRQVAHAVGQALQLPESLRDWSDDHHAAFQIARGWNLPGDRVYGDRALALLMEARQAEPMPAASKPAAYLAQTGDSQDAAVGSSAGGEQPKFLALTEDRGHVIVKFAKRRARMGHLLRLEHLALECLRDAGIPAARTHLLEHQDFTFLEIERFDRVGRHGRVGMVSAGALDDELFGHRDSWSQFAQRCVAQRLLSGDQALRIHTLAAYSELIGNTDRHFENISLLLEPRGTVVDVAPAYDVLPMQYAPIGGGIDPPLLPVRPKLGAVGGRADAWGSAQRAARDFWTRVRDGAVPGIGAEMRALARQNLEVVERFVEPLVHGQA